MTRDRAYAVLASLKPAQVFLDSYNMKTLPLNLQFLFGPPEEFFMASPEQLAHYDATERLVPLLDDGNFDSILYYDPDRHEFVLKYVEDEEPTAVFKNWQQYLASLIRRLVETGDEDDNLRRTAEIIGFHDLDATLAHLASTAGLPSEEDAREWDRFVASLEA